MWSNINSKMLSIYSYPNRAYLPVGSSCNLIWPIHACPIITNWRGINSISKHPVVVAEVILIAPIIPKHANLCSLLCSVIHLSYHTKDALVIMCLTTQMYVQYIIFNPNPHAFP